MIPLDLSLQEHRDMTNHLAIAVRAMVATVFVDQEAQGGALMGLAAEVLREQGWSDEAILAGLQRTLEIRGPVEVHLRRSMMHEVPR